MGDRLGYYRDLAATARPRPEELAARTGTGAAVRPRVAQRPGRRGRSSTTTRPPVATRCPPEHAVALADETSPAYLPGFFQIALGTVRDAHRVIAAARRRAGSAGTSTTATSTRGASGSSGRGTPPTWSPSGCPRSTAWWRSSSGSRVADVGCGHGSSTVLMARGVPALDVPRLRLPRRVDRHRTRAGDRRRGRRSGQLRGRRGHGVRRRGLRPGDDVRLPARHGRPGRRGQARARA